MLLLLLHILMLSSTLLFFTISVMKMLCFRPHSRAVKEDSRIHDSTYNTILHKEEKLDWSSTSDYDDDLYTFYRLDECHSTASSKGYNKVDSDMRRDVIDWLIDTHYGLELTPETLYLCVNILDRFLSKSKLEATTTTEKEFELVGVTSLLLASKYEQQGALSVYELEYITQYSCTPDEICDMESVILQKLDWVLTVPTPYVFLLRYIRACVLCDDDKVMENMVFFFSELSLTHYPIVCGYRPSVIAASAVYCARIVVGRYPFWSKALKTCTGYPVKKLRSCAKAMMNLCGQTCRDGSMDVFRKFSSPNYRKVACVAQQEFSKNLSDLRIRLNMGQHHSIQFKCLSE